MGVLLFDEYLHSSSVLDSDQLPSRPRSEGERRDIFYTRTITYPFDLSRLGNFKDRNLNINLYVINLSKHTEVTVINILTNKFESCKSVNTLYTCRKIGKLLRCNKRCIRISLPGAVHIVHRTNNKEQSK